MFPTAGLKSKGPDTRILNGKGATHEDMYMCQCGKFVRQFADAGTGPRRGGRPARGRPRETRGAQLFFATLRFVEKNADRKALSHEDIFRLHKIIAGEVMDQGSGRYRIIAIRVGRHVPPLPVDVSGLIDFLHLSDNSHVLPRYASEHENH